MRLVLQIRDTAVIDLDLRWPHRPEPDTRPKLTAGSDLARGEIADDVGFGFAARRPA